jgi:DNA-binding MarR family transcriptional regulator
MDYDRGMRTEPLVSSLERIAVGAVGVTTQALARVHGVDMTFPQWRALVILGETADGARIGEVAARTGVTLPATGRLLRRLERRGLLALATDPADRRATRATLTNAGQAVLDDILARRRAVLAEVADAVSARGSMDFAAGLDAVAEELERRT